MSGEWSAVALAAALRRRELSAAEALDDALERADAVEATLNPFSLRLDERARGAARRADAALARGEGGPLCGVPVTTKDSHWMAGVESASGSRARAGFVPDETMGGIERLEAAGAVIFARTAVPEFCYFGITESDLLGRTSNPWDPGRVPGGSSGGAAVAVAAGAGTLSLGGDGGGSIRIPAAFCGVVGFKPTFGLVAHEPSSAGWKTLVAVGPLARSVADARLMLRAVAGPDPRDRHGLSAPGLDAPAPDPADLRVVVSEDLGFAPLDADVRRVFRHAVAALEAAGVELVRTRPGSAPRWTCGARSPRPRPDGRRPTSTSTGARASRRGPWTSSRPASYVGVEPYVRAQFARERIHRAYADLLDRTGATCLVTPTLGCEAFPHGARHPDAIGDVPIGYPNLDWAPFLYDANLAGLPACALPIGLGDDGLPVSVQVLGPRAGDGAVLAAAEVIERVVGFDARPPAPVPTPGPGPAPPGATSGVGEGSAQR